MNKLLLILAGVSFLLSSCNKLNLPAIHKYSDDETWNSPRLSGTMLPRTVTVCINSFSELQEKIGTRLVVKSVLLDNGQLITMGKDDAKLYYTAIDTHERNSLFRSDLTTEYKDRGTVITHKQEVWSLGCSLVKSGAPPFTNILLGNTIYLINTSLVWSVPPLASSGHKILWLVI